MPLYGACVGISLTLEPSRQILKQRKIIPSIIHKLLLLKSNIKRRSLIVGIDNFQQKSRLFVNLQYFRR
jgi:hypothetical protein